MTAALVLGLAAAIALNWESVLSGVETAVSQQDSTASAADVRNTASATLLSSGAAAAVLVLLGFVALNLLRNAAMSSKVLMGAVGLLTIGAAVTFSTFVSDAPALLGGVLQWGPFVVAGTAAAATIVASYPEDPHASEASIPSALRAAVAHEVEVNRSSSGCSDNARHLCTAASAVSRC